MAMQNKAIDGLEGLLALAGITLGAIPFGGWVIAKEHSGPFRWLFGEHTGAMGYVVPLLVLGVAVLLIAVLEGAKRRV
ncbi:hypothetical protein [Amycolatopsis cihanbeyliensis]|uniref:Uncharacterized protein n=1 Tax=Amycolatopsis cihanbeyliensis TaxID=1128664 RepID=A0A542CUM7_AMYCI|nr:hypothetical protein [Amycolatopsis cihanbeyliensis]TQI94511.1 hypothetical protein FB471_6677 [Amycolatopsis cihanbeyliensis]